MDIDDAFIRACSCYSFGWYFGARGLCLEVLKRQPESQQTATLLRLCEIELVKQPPCDSRFFVIGDSHIECFDIRPKTIFEPVHLGPRTLYRLGHGWLDGIDLHNFGIRDVDCVTFVGGDIDVRLHIGRIRDLRGLSIEEIIEDIVVNYVGAITRARSTFTNLDCLVASVVPPTGPEYRPNIPDYFYGDTIDRLEITLRLNLRLETECRLNGIGFVDLYTPFADPDGLMDISYLDELTHVRRDFVDITCGALMTARAALHTEG